MFKKILLLSFISLLFATQSNAASLDLQSDIENIQINSYFQVDVFLNAEDVSVNAVEAKISFPAELIQLKEIRNGNSVISFWVDQPKAIDNVITFSGIIPGGYNEKKGLISSLIFESKKYGAGAVKFDTFQALKNDGLGTTVNLKSSNFGFYIVEKSEEHIIVEMEDYVKPENFTPEINKVQEMFDGQYFLVFASQDKGMGIDHYEVCEGDVKNCIKTESPYLLKNQELNDKIYVKAVDKKGNERLVSLNPQNKEYEKYLIFTVVVLMAILIICLIKKRWKKSKK